MVLSLSKKASQFPLQWLRGLDKAERPRAFMGDTPWLSVVLPPLVPPPPGSGVPECRGACHRHHRMGHSRKWAHKVQSHSIPPGHGRWSVRGVVHPMLGPASQGARLSVLWASSGVSKKASGPGLGSSSLPPAVSPLYIEDESYVLKFCVR